MTGTRIREVGTELVFKTRISEKKWFTCLTQIVTFGLDDKLNDVCGSSLLTGQRQTMPVIQNCRRGYCDEQFLPMQIDEVAGVVFAYEVEKPFTMVFAVVMGNKLIATDKSATAIHIKNQGVATLAFNSIPTAGRFRAIWSVHGNSPRGVSTVAR